MSPVVAITAPKSADDMTGSIGFGAGLVGGSNIITSVNADLPPGAVPPPTKFVAVRYWQSDTLVLQPSLFFAFTKTSGSDASWTLDPELVALFVPVKGASTRLLVGGGLGINLAKAGPADTTFAFYLPIQAGVEHAFTRWFAMGIAARTNFFQMQTGEPWNITMAISSTSLLGNLFFYTD